MTDGAPALLGEPLRVGRHVLRNRIISAPMERNLATEDGLLTDTYLRYLEARAAGGAALVFTESTYVRADGRARRRQAGIHDDAVLGPLAQLADAIHRHGALLGVELNHGGRTAQRAVNGVGCVAPSPVPCAVAGGEIPAALTDEDIRDIIRCYARAALRCEQAGVDVVMLHGAHGYLINQFLSPRTNHRTDAWAAPVRFLTEVISAVREAVPTMTLGIRFSALEGPPDGLDAAQMLDLVSQAPLHELDFLDISAGSYEAGEWIVQPAEWDDGVLAPYAEPYRQLGLPVSVVGRISDPATAERILQAGQADLVTIGRALHADPNWSRAAVAGQSYRPCIASNLCIDQLFTMQPIPCSVNSDVGAASQNPTADLAGGSAVVVGSGPAGLEAARAAAERGMHVVLHERDDAIGGQVRLSAVLRTYPHFHRILDWYTEELDRLGVEIRLGSEPTPSAIAAVHPDLVVLALGSRAILPDLDDERHVVWGADRVGVAVADELLRRGKRLLIIGEQETLAPEVGRRAKILTVPRLTQHPDVQLLLGTNLRAVTPDALAVERTGTERVVDAPGPVLVSQGTAPRDGMGDALAREGYPGAVIVVGDADGAGDDIAHAIAGSARAIGALAPASA